MGKALVLLFGAAIVFACSADYLLWAPRSKSADPLYRFVTNGKAGYIDGTGKVVVPPILRVYGNYGAEFHDGLLEVPVSDGKYVDRSGKIVLDKDLYRGWDFSEGLAAASPKGAGLWGYIDTSGRFAISPRFEGPVSSFSDGVAKVEVKGRFGYIDRTGEFTVPPSLYAGENFSEGLARVVVEGPCVYWTEGACPGPVFAGGRDGAGRPACRFTFADKTGRVLTAQRFDNARNFSEGLAPVEVGGLWGFIDKNGVMVVSPRFEDAMPFSSGLARIRRGMRWGYANTRGKVVVAPVYDYAEDFSDGLAGVGDRKEAWYIDKSGSRAFLEAFALVSPFFKGLAHVRLKSLEANSIPNYAYIDTKGRHVFTYLAGGMTN
jgi:hypothetical protein